MFSRCKSIALFAMLSGLAVFAAPVPRTVDGKPDLQGIWQVRGKAANDLLAEKGVVEGGAIPYQAWAAAKKQENFKNRQTADPLGKCFFPGVPRIMYMEYPFQIFQTPEQRRDHVRVVSGVPADQHQRQTRAPRCGGNMDGRFARPLGRQHPGGRRHRPQR